MNLGEEASLVHPPYHAAVSNVQLVMELSVHAV